MVLPRLILHFDVNETIILEDAAGGDTRSDCVNKCIAKSLYLRSTNPPVLLNGENLTDLTSPLSIEDAMKSIHTSFEAIPGATSYYKSPLKPNVRNWDLHPHGKLLVKLRESVSNKMKSHFILPAFFTTVVELTRQKREFSIVIRTFGSDLGDIFTAISSFAKGEHPQFPEFQDASLIIDPLDTEMKLVYERDGVFTVSNQDRCLSQKEFLSEIERKRIFGVTDDYDFWSKNGCKPACGKPAFTTQNQNGFHHILFDDNINCDADNSIVGVYEIPAWTLLSGKATIKLHNHCIVRVPTISAIFSPRFFLDAIKLCEQNRAET